MKAPPLQSHENQESDSTSEWVDENNEIPTLLEEVEDFFRNTLPSVEGFQSREPQEKMALTVAYALQHKERLAIEAGTGTGKSVAYLVPLLLRKSSKDSPAIIATKTVQLQHQLLKRDLPILQELLSTPRTIVQAKGWSNYACVRKLESPDESTTRLLGPAITKLRKLFLNRSGVLTRQEAPVNKEQWNKIKADPLD